MFYVYILFSEKLNKYYVGYTADITNRILNYHNAGRVTFTSKGIPWLLMYSESYHSEKDAMRREKQIKKMKSRKYIESLIGSSAG